MRGSSFKYFPTECSTVPLSQSMFLGLGAARIGGSCVPQINPLVTTNRFLSTFDTTSASNTGAASHAIDTNRVLSKQRSTSTANSVTNTNFLRSAGLGSVGVETHIPALFSKRHSSTTAEVGQNTETFLYIHRTDLHGTTTPLNEVFSSRTAADEFVRELEAKGTKNHYSVEDITATRQVLKSTGTAAPSAPTSGPEPTAPSMHGQAVSRGGGESLTRVSLQDLGAPLKVSGVDEEAEKLRAKYERVLYEVWRTDTKGNSVRMDPIHGEESKAEAVVAELQSQGNKGQQAYVQAVRVTDHRGLEAQRQLDEDDGWD